MPIQIPNGLVEAVKQRQAVLFAGAGMSYPALRILGSHVRDEIGKDIKKDYADYEPSQRSFEDVCDENNTVLFVGYGLRDEHVRRLLTHIRRQRGTWARRAYAVGYFDEPRTKLLDKRNIQALNVAGPTNQMDSGIDVFMSDLIQKAGIV